MTAYKISIIKHAVFAVGLVVAGTALGAAAADPWRTIPACVIIGVVAGHHILTAWQGYKTLRDVQRMMKEGTPCK